MNNGKDSKVPAFSSISPEEMGTGRTRSLITITAKLSVMDAFMELGGVEALVEWGKTNPTEFYRIWSKLLPKEVDIGTESGLESLLNRLAKSKEDGGILEGEFEVKEGSTDEIQ